MPRAANGYSRAYLRHRLYMAGEILVLRLFSEHNLYLYGRLVREARAAIEADAIDAFVRAWTPDASP